MDIHVTQAIAHQLLTLDEAQYFFMVRDFTGGIVKAALFGMLIANEDMHFGNVSLFCPEPLARKFSLAPAYDMLPMRYRPRDEDPMPDPGFEPPAPHAGVLEAWAAAVSAATHYWDRVATDTEISAGFRRIAERNRAGVGSLATLPPAASTR